MWNYKKEYKKAKENYEHFSIAIEKKLGQEFKEELKKDNMSISKWFKKMIFFYTMHKNEEFISIKSLQIESENYINQGNCDTCLLMIFNNIALNSIKNFEQKAKNEYIE